MKSKIKAQTPNNPRLGCSASGHPLCWQDTTLVWREQPKGPRAFGQHSTVWAGVSPSTSPWHVGCEPLLPTSSPSSDISLLQALHLLPGHGCPPPPATSDIPQLPSDQEQQEPMFPGWMQHKGGTWEDTHTQTRDKRAIRSLENKELVIMKKGQIS